MAWGVLPALLCQGNRGPPKKSSIHGKVCLDSHCSAFQPSSRQGRPLGISRPVFPRLRGPGVILWPACQAWGCSPGVIAEAPGRCNKQPEVSEAVFPNLHPFPAKGGGGRSLGWSRVRSPLMAASITVYKWPRSRRYRAAAAESVPAASAPSSSITQPGRAPAASGKSSGMLWQQQQDPARSSASLLP